MEIAITHQIKNNWYVENQCDGFQLISMVKNR